MSRITCLSRMRRSLGEYSPSSRRLRVAKAGSWGRQRESLTPKRFFAIILSTSSWYKIWNENGSHGKDNIKHRYQVFIIHLAIVPDFTFRVTEGALRQRAGKNFLFVFKIFVPFFIFYRPPAKEEVSELFSRQIPSSFSGLAEYCTWKPRALQKSLKRQEEFGVGVFFGWRGWVCLLRSTYWCFILVFGFYTFEGWWWTCFPFPSGWRNGRSFA